MRWVSSPDLVNFLSLKIQNVDIPIKKEYPLKCANREVLFRNGNWITKSFSAAQSFYTYFLPVVRLSISLATLTISGLIAFAFPNVARHFLPLRRVP